MLHLIHLSLRGRPHYWNTCGWTDSRRCARHYTAADVQAVIVRMRKAGLDRVIPLRA